MLGFCQCSHVTDLTLTADMGADPLWCGICGDNLDLYDLPLAPQLQQKLMLWANAYGSWVDWSTQQVIAGAKQLEKHHNLQGAELQGQVQAQVGPKIKVTFVPSQLY